ncbi:MAG: GNAT family N-acetyltransferase [Chloroflexi bacterium]|nr:GNAT family N-acetyltransferase [Chloroflexota bacterium]
MKIEPDSWLANIFGYPVFKVTLASEESTVTANSFAQAAASSAAFLYAKISTTRIDQVRTLTAHGFNVVDVNVTLDRIPALNTDSDDKQIIVRDLRADEHDAVLKIAETSFVYSRFHLDPQIPNQLANAIKRAWIKSYCQKERGERLLIAEVDGKPVGFLAVLKTTINGESARVIDLITVDKAYQRQGIGRALVNFFIRDSVNAVSRLRVGTQAANIPSLQLYENLGFRIAETTFVLHAHFRNGEASR